jgi:hypothetical protein
MCHVQTILFECLGNPFGPRDASSSHWLSVSAPEPAARLVMFYLGALARAAAHLARA